MKKLNKKQKDIGSKPNYKVVVYSIIALGCLALSFIVNWLYIIPAVILVFLNHRELMGKNNR